MAQHFNYGGQAVMEGVMIRGKKALAIAVRRPNGEIVTKIQPLSSLYTGVLRNIPFVRGVIVLVETLALGVQALMYSANVSLEDEDVEVPSGMMWGTMAVALVLAVGFFFVLPLLVMRGVGGLLPPTSVLSHVLEGLLRLALFMLYIWGVGFVPDIKRVFAYHGAEHKAVNAFEHGAEMEVSKVQQFSTAHSRCGTAFVLVFFIIALIAFVLLGRSELLWERLVWRIVLLPVIAAISYEIIRFGARYGDNRIVSAIFSPSLALQALSTRQPDDSQVEVAVHALRAARDADGVPPSASAATPSNG
ncbi:MAG: DUF1385 domain-containing protein [Dehalococcoidia bacterium]|nr:DUF1385 domain-containing protein [Dehalococcoidia bacterium]